MRYQDTVYKSQLKESCQNINTHMYKNEYLHIHPYKLSKVFGMFKLLVNIPTPFHLITRVSIQDSGHILMHHSHRTN